MKYLDLLREAIRQRSTFGDEPLENLDLPEGLDELWALRSEMKVVIDGARALLAATEDALSYVVGDGAARMGGSVATTTQAVKRKVIRPTAFWDFLYSVFGPKDVTRLFNPNQVRVGELKKLIDEHGLDYDTVMSTLFDESRELPRLQVRPSHLAPKWQQALPEGRVVRKEERRE